MLTGYRPWSKKDLDAHLDSMLEDSSVMAVTGEKVGLDLGKHEVSLCCHSDSPGAVDIVTTARTFVNRFNEKYHTK